MKISVSSVNPLSDVIYELDAYLSEIYDDVLL